MKDNRYSMAPNNKNKGLANSNSNSNLQSNIKGNQQGIHNDSKSRKSTNPMLFPRATTFSSMTKFSDPRPIKDANFQEECMGKICNFLIRGGYDRAISKKDLQSPQAKEFVTFFTFLVLKIRPDWNFQINKLDEDIIPMLNELRYPGYITKNHLVAVGAPNTWPHLLAVLAWLVELATYLHFDEEEEQKLELQELEKTSQFGNSINDYLSNPNNNIDPNNIQTLTIASSLAQQENIFEHSYRDFLYEGFKQSVTKGDNFLAIENFQKKTNDLVTLNFSNADKLKQETRNLEQLAEELERNYPTLNETKLKVEVQSRELTNLKAKLETNMRHLSESIANEESSNQIYSAKNAKYEESVKLVEELEETVKTQKVSYEENEKNKQIKSNLDKQIQNLINRKNELNELIWNTKNKNDSYWNALYERVKWLTQISEKLQIAKERLEHLELIQNMCEKDRDSIISLDITEINAKFQESNHFLKSETEIKNMEKKEKDEYLINLKSEMRRLEDKIAQGREMLIQKETDLERENSLIAIEKEKFSQIMAQKNEEIRKMNENIQKMSNLLSEKERDLEETKNLEISLTSKFNEEDEAAESFIKELEGIFQDTYIQIESMKNENIHILRKSHKSLQKSFERMQKLMGDS